MEAIDLREFLDQRFGGVLTKGCHAPDGAACFHEALNVYQGKDWSDSTEGTLDFRGLNDSPHWSSDKARTDAMLPLGSLVLAWPSWSAEKQQAWATRVAEQTIRQIVPPALRAAGTLLPTHREALEAAAQRCADEGTESAAESAWAVAWAAAESAEWAVRSAASAEWAVRSAASAAVEDKEAPLRLICQIMAEAAL